MSATIRDHAARDRAWGRHYARQGLAPPTRSIAVPTPAQRRAEYAWRRALADEATRSTT